MAAPFSFPTKYFHVWHLTVSQANVLIRLFSTARPSRVATIFVPTSNTGTFYFGDADVTTTDFSFVLTAGGQFVTYVDDLSKIFYMATAVGDVIHAMVEWGYADSADDYSLQQQPLTISGIGPVGVQNYDKGVTSVEGIYDNSLEGGYDNA